MGAATGGGTGGTRPPPTLRMEGGRPPQTHYGASEASVVFRRLTEISEYAVVTLLLGLYLSNHLTDLHAVIFCRVASFLLPSN